VGVQQDPHRRQLKARGFWLMAFINHPSIVTLTRCSLCVLRRLFWCNTHSFYSDFFYFLCHSCDNRTLLKAKPGGTVFDVCFTFLFLASRNVVWVLSCATNWLSFPCSLLCPCVLLSSSLMLVVPCASRRRSFILWLWHHSPLWDWRWFVPPLLLWEGHYPALFDPLLCVLCLFCSVAPILDSSRVFSFINPFPFFDFGPLCGFLPSSNLCI